MPRTSKNAWRQTELEILRALKKLGAGTLYEIGDELNVRHKWIGFKIIQLRLANRVYISGWQKKYLTGPSRPLFSLKLADEEDEPAPIPMTPSQKTMNYLKRKKLKELLFHD